MFNELDIHDALRACYTTLPIHSQPLNIVDLGLIEHIHLAPDLEAPGAGIPGVLPRQALTLTLLSPAADADAQTQLHAQIANRLAGLPQLSQTSIHFIDAPPWTPARLTPEGRRILQLDFPILNNAAPRPIPSR